MPAPETDSDDDFSIFPDFLDFGSSDDDSDSNGGSSSPDDRAFPESPKSSDSTTDSDNDNEAMLQTQQRRASRPFMSLQQRRMSKLGYKNVGLQMDEFANLQRRHSEAVSIQNNNVQPMEAIAASPTSPSSESMFSPAKQRWRKSTSTHLQNDGSMGKVSPRGFS